MGLPVAAMETWMSQRHATLRTLRARGAAWLQRGCNAPEDAAAGRHHQEAAKPASDACLGGEGGLDACWYS